MTTDTRQGGRPKALPVDPGNVPAELCSLDQWVVWNWAPKPDRPGEWTKVPLMANADCRASSTDPRTWSSFDDALGRADRDGLPGIGFVFSEDDPYTGIDLDKCRDPETGTLTDWARSILTELDSYAELSPSGTGVHIIVRGSLPTGEHVRRRAGTVEMYSSGRYFTVNGNWYPGTPATIADRQAKLSALYTRTFGTNGTHARPRATTGASILSDEDVIGRARSASNAPKFLSLWAGDTSEYGGDDSAADLALASMLSFWTQDLAQLDRLFRRSGLMRDKWERTDYRDRTIAVALDRTERWASGTRSNRSERPLDDDSTAGPDPSQEAPAVAPFPDHILPEAARAYCVSAARSLGADVPLAMVTAPLLAFVGALAGNRVYLVLKPSWSERGGLTVAIVGAPGTIKSPALRHAKWPITALQEDAKEIFDAALARYKADYATWKKDQVGEEPERPRMREYFTSDTTMEALAELLGCNPGICIIVDELRGWVLGFDKYRAKGGNDRQQALSLWGSETIKVNRKTGDPVYVSAPVASVAGGLQPDYADAFQAGKNGTDGSTERVLPVVCDHGAQAWTDATIATEHYSAIADLFRQIDLLPAPDREPGKPRGMGIELSLGARKAWIDFYDQNSRRVNAASGLEAGMLQKLSSHTARLALILHLLWHADDPRVMVTEQTMVYAIELSDWWRGHINRFLWLLGKHVANAAETPLKMRIVRILRKDRDDDRARWVTRSDIYRELRNVSPDELSAALAALHGEGVIERREAATATKPVEWWRVRTQHSHYSHYSPEPDESSSDHRENANNANNPGRARSPQHDDDGWEVA
ncbi:MAG: DUF3987 domain-containing protein [Chloroflexota bacterium]|nr:DUF3987 domain-containing protein [Chloroflexota bacterium]